MSERLMQAESMNYEDDTTLRPQRLNDYVGQKELKENMIIVRKRLFILHTKIGYL